MEIQAHFSVALNLIVMNSQMVWLASYPRSGNTLLRTILQQCFGLWSASVYPDDLGKNRRLEAYVGHIEHGSDGKVRFPKSQVPLFKTHEYPSNSHPAIYVVRDGRAAAASLWNFYNQELPLREVIAGHHRFGTWSDHLHAWEPLTRPDTLLIRYEDMTADLPSVLAALETFLDRRLVGANIPTRSKLSEIDGKWVRKESNWESIIKGEALKLFYRINASAMRKLGYSK
jgi:hypothetical protein